MNKIYKHEEKIDKEFQKVYRLLEDKAVSLTGTAGKDGKDGVNGHDGTDGKDGQSAYLYIAYADDESGSGFTMVFSSAKNYIAFKSTTSIISNPQATDFAGLWKKMKGENGQGVPAGGSAGQVLTKASNNDFEAVWATVVSALGQFRQSLLLNSLSYTPCAPSNIATSVSLS